MKQLLAMLLLASSVVSAQTDPLLEELEALTERIGEREPTAAEQRQIDDIIERMQQRGVAEMQQLVDGMVDASQGTAGSISLPVYPDAQLLIHIPASGSMTLGDEQYATLPGASFVTDATPEQVLAFYRQQLPSYQLHRPSLLSATDTALMQHLPAGFDYVRDTGIAMGIPHIYIQPASDNERRNLASARTLFFVYYP